MSHLIPFNSSKVVQNGYNNIYTHQFVGSSVNLTDAEVAIHSISMYNSVFNIDGQAFGNNQLVILMPAAATTATITIKISDGLYSYTDLNLYIQSQLVALGAYLINADGDFVHYFRISENATYYACQVDLSPVPTTLPNGWSRPATGLYSTGGLGLPTTSRVPILDIQSEAFGKIIGFSISQYPATPQTTLQSFLSNRTPQIHPITACLVRCNLVSNPYVLPSDVIGSFDTQGTQAGQLISYKPNEYAWVPISNGVYSSITISIVGQDEQFVKIRDPNLQIILAIRSKKKKE